MSSRAASGRRIMTPCCRISTEVVPPRRFSGGVAQRTHVADPNRGARPIESDCFGRLVDAHVARLVRPATDRARSGSRSRAPITRRRTGGQPTPRVHPSRLCVHLWGCERSRLREDPLVGYHPESPAPESPLESDRAVDGLRLRRRRVRLFRSPEDLVTPVDSCPPGRLRRRDLERPSRRGPRSSGGRTSLNRLSSANTAWIA